MCSHFPVLAKPQEKQIIRNPHQTKKTNPQNSGISIITIGGNSGNSHQGISGLKKISA